MTPKYVPIRVSTLRGDKPITFNAYVRVAGKFILFCREGDSFENDRLDRLKGKKLNRMFIQTEQEQAYKTYMTENIRNAWTAAANQNIDARAQIIQGVLQGAAEDLMEDLSNDANYNVLMSAAKQFQSFVVTEEQALKALMKIQNEDNNVAAHGLNVASLSIGIAEEMKIFKEPADMGPMIVGALLHDVEHAKNNLDRTYPAKKLSPNEYSIFSKHARDGAAKIRENHFYHPLIAKIIEQHEELLDGSGLNRTKERDIEMIPMIVATANAYDHYLHYEGMDTKEALRAILMERMGQLSLDTMKALQNSLKKKEIIK